MSLSMTRFAYIPETWKAFAKNLEDRSSVFRELVERLGGSCSLSTTALASTMGGHL